MSLMDEIRPEYDVAAGVGGDFAGDFDEITHPTRMTSLPSVFSIAN